MTDPRDPPDSPPPRLLARVTLPAGASIHATLTERSYAALSPTLVPPEPAPAPSTAVDTLDDGSNAALTVRRNEPARTPAAPAATRAPELVLPTVTATPPVGLSDPFGDARAPDLELIGILGQGGMGRVYLGRQRALRRDVAVKLMRPDTASPDAVSALVNEARIAGALEHPNVLPVHLLGTDAQGLPVLVMKRAEGVAWSALLADDEHPAWATLPAGRRERLVAHVEILMAVCNAVHFAHARGVIHRDIKPENVMVGLYGEVHLMDWGIALTRASQAAHAPDDWRGPVGTPAYMAPEMVRGDAVDERSDVFLLGAVLHEVLTRTSRHAGETVMAVLVAALEPEPVAYPPTVPEELGALANRATCADPSARPASAAAFRDALDDYLAHRGSARLAERARGFYAQLEAIARAPTPDPVAYERASSACRFAYAQALREWPDNAAARDGLHALLRLLVRGALARGDVRAATGLLAELPEADPALTREVDDARAREARVRAAAKRAAAVAGEMDLDVGATQRRIFYVILAALSVVWGSTSMIVRAVRGLPFTHRSLLTFAVVFAVCVTSLTLYGRQALFRNVINRRVTSLPMLAAWTLLLHRTLATLRGLAPATIVADDLLLMAAIASVAALLLERAYALTAALLAVAGLVAWRVPTEAQSAFTVGGSLGMLSAALLWLRDVRSPVRPSAVPPPPSGAA